MTTRDPTPADLIHRLIARADSGSADGALLREAAEIIETLRGLVGIRQEIELEDSEPEGHA